jgi:hypothetical protein
MLMDRRNKQSWIRVHVLVDYRLAVALGLLCIAIWLLMK